MSIPQPIATIVSIALVAAGTMIPATTSLAQNDRKLTARVDERKIDKAFELQKDPMWCWAACIQLCLRHNGIEVTQQQIVQRTFGAVVGAPGNWIQMTQRLNGVMKAADKTIIVSGDVFMGSPTAESIVNHLKADNPIIISFQIPQQNIGHAVLVTGVEYRIINEKVVIVNVELRDPYPYDPDHVNRRGKVKIPNNHPVLRSITHVWLVRATIE